MKCVLLRFQDSLAEIQTQINQRNTDIVEENRRKARTGNNENLHKYPYEWLLPKNVLNSISIWSMWPKHSLNYRHTGRYWYIVNMNQYINKVDIIIHDTRWDTI